MAGHRYRSGGEVLAPSAYQAVASYSGRTSYQVPTGYITTADYKGEVTAEGVDSVTYTVVYTGTEIVPEQPIEPIKPVEQGSFLFGCIMLALLLAGLAGFSGKCLGLPV